METFSLALVALSALYITPSALALKCEVCTNIPAQMGMFGKPCTEPAVMECTFGLDRCMTVNGRMTIPSSGSLDITLKNCSSSFLMCAPDGIANLCKLLNTTGMMSSCETNCCKEDNCNGDVSGAEVPGLSVWLTSFTTILMALYQKFLL